MITLFMELSLKIFLFTFFTLLSNLSNACLEGEDGKFSFIEKNNLRVEIDSPDRNSMTEEKFNFIIDRVDKIYRPIVESRGTFLRWKRNWKNPKVNAFASRTYDANVGKKVWNVSMYGGLARHEAITDDAFYLVACHEVGHHLGGAPLLKKGMNQWASNEGQSDYFAVTKCMRKIFEEDNNIELVSKMKIPEILKSKCSEHFSNENEAAICMRTAMAGKSFTNLMTTATWFTRLFRIKLTATDFNKTDNRVIYYTNDMHPRPQCRLDTYFQGSLCDKSAYNDMSSEDSNVGSCNSSENYDFGLRPACWFIYKR